jgi:hypothetical protein
VWVHKWSSSSLPCSFNSQILWKDIFPIFAWTIWSGRYKTTMEGTPFDGTYILKRVKSLILEFFYHRSDMSTSIRKEPVLIGWTPPPFGFVKLNSDGSAFENPGSSGAGRVLRDCAGKWLSGFTRHIGVTTFFMAEL